MSHFLQRRLATAVLVLLAISLLSFFMLKMSGDLAISLAGDNSGAEYVEFLRRTYGWDRPLHVQYADWLWKALHGDFGQSFYYGQPVFDLIRDRMPVTFRLGAWATGLALVVAIPLGVLAAIRPGSWLDRLVLLFALTASAMPIFWTSFLLIGLFAITLRWLPISGGTDLAHLAMPTMALAFFAMPGIIRIVRSGMIEVMAADYTRTARAKGLRPYAVLWRHALRNTLVPVVAVASVQFGFLLGGSVVVETIFAVNGIGYLTWQAINQNDYPVVQAAVLTVSSCYVLLTVFADLINRALDPRIRLD